MILATSKFESFKSRSEGNSAPHITFSQFRLGGVVLHRVSISQYRHSISPSVFTKISIELSSIPGNLLDALLNDNFKFYLDILHNVHGNQQLSSHALPNFC